jgi:hypothetical protein
MRATATGLAAAVLVLAASAAHADPAFLLPQTCVPPNPIFYGPGACQGCLYGPNYYFQGACLPPNPYNGALAFPRRPAPQGAAGMTGYTAPLGGGPATFPTHPFAHSPRDFFMYGQQYND